MRSTSGLLAPGGSILRGTAQSGSPTAGDHASATPSDHATAAPPPAPAATAAATVRFTVFPVVVPIGPFGFDDEWRFHGCVLTDAQQQWRIDRRSRRRRRRWQTDATPWQFGLLGATVTATTQPATACFGAILRARRRSREDQEVQKVCLLSTNDCSGESNLTAAVISMQPARLSLSFTFYMVAIWERDRSPGEENMINTGRLLAVGNNRFELLERGRRKR